MKFPRLGADRGIIVEWLHSPGDHVQVDESLVIVEVDKVDIEIPSPAKGKLVEVLVEKGAEVKVGAPICVVETMD